jgi:hypothetical protein
MSTWNEPASLIVAFSSLFRLCRIMALRAHVEEGVASQESAEERTRKRKEYASNGLIIKECQVESTEGDQDDPPPGETVVAPQPPAPTTNSFPVSCVILESEDCESLAGE